MKETAAQLKRAFRVVFLMVRAELLQVKKQKERMEQI